MNKKKKDKSRRVWLIVIALLVVLFGVELSANHGVLAKYITSRTQPQSLVTTNNYYFRSNYLEDQATPPVVNLNPGTTSVDIELYNFADELRVSELGINYTVSIESVKDSNDNNATSAVTDAVKLNNQAQATGTIAKGADKKTATVVLSGLQNGYKYTVKAESHSDYKATGENTATSGYIKTIKATFVVANEEPKVYKYLDKSNNDYCLLMVWTTGSAKGAATITYPADLIPDNTDPAMSGWGAPNKYPDNASFVDYYSSHTYRFFYNTGYDGKNNPDLTVKSFTVRVGDTAAPDQPGTP